MISKSKKELVGTVRGRQRGLRPLGGKSKVTRTHRNKKGQLVIVTTMPDGKTKTTVVKGK